MITPKFPPEVSGLGYYVFNLCNELVKRGHEVTVFTRGSWKRSHPQHMKGIRVYETPFIPVYPFHVQLHGIFTNRLFKLMEPNFDVVHIHHPLPPLIHTSLPTMVTLHGLMRNWSDFPLQFNPSLQFLTYRVFSGFIFPFELKILRNADLLTSVSYTTARELNAFYGFDENTIKIIGNGVDNEFFIPSESDRNSSYVLYSGRLAYRKGLIDLVKSAKYVCSKHPSAFYVIAGDGPLRNHLRKLVNKMGLSDKIFIISQINKMNILKYYQNAAVLALPSYYESLPNTILEAMACGLPIVATPIGDIPRIVKNGRTGFLVPPRNPEALGEAILKLLKEESLRKKMGEASREEVKRSYSCHSLADRVMDCYKLIMN